MVIASAPAKTVIFGEYSSVYGEPALALAVDLRVFCTAKVDRNALWLVNNRPMTERQHTFLKRSAELFWDGPPISFRTRSQIPSATGMGSSASLSVATNGALMALELAGDESVPSSNGTGTKCAGINSCKTLALDRFECAKRAHEIEGRIEKQSVSPIDTFTSAFGGGVVVSKKGSRFSGFNFEGDLESDGSAWSVYSRKPPAISIVIGHTRVKARTREVSARVNHFFTRKKGFAMEIVKEMGDVARDGIDALFRNDLERAGRMMDKNHSLLAVVGANTPELERLVWAARKHSYGAKLTGSGGGGCMVCLTDKPDKVAKEILRAGGKPYVVGLSKEGLMASLK